MKPIFSSKKFTVRPYYALVGRKVWFLNAVALNAGKACVKCFRRTDSMSVGRVERVGEVSLPSVEYI